MGSHTHAHIYKLIYGYRIIMWGRFCWRHCVDFPIACIKVATPHSITSCRSWHCIDISIQVDSRIVHDWVDLLNVMRYATNLIHVQWGINLMSARSYKVSVNHMFLGSVRCFTETNQLHREACQSSSSSSSLSLSLSPVLWLGFVIGSLRNWSTD